MVKCDVILKPPPLIANPGYAGGSLQVRIVDFFFFKLISVIFDQVQRNLIFFDSKTLNFQRLKEFCEKYLSGLNLQPDNVG